MNRHSIAPFIQKFYPQYYSWHKYPADKCVVIHKVADQWGILCNFGDTPLVVDGVRFANVEQLFQMMKFKDVEPLKELYAVSGLSIKMKAKKWESTHRRDDWPGMIVDALKFCLMLKYEQCPDFREALRKSKDLYIVEDQSSNTKKTADTWGVKRKRRENEENRENSKEEEDFFEGPNLLGRLLMELRDNGSLEYNLPSESFDFIQIIKQNNPTSNNTINTNNTIN